MLAMTYRYLTTSLASIALLLTPLLAQEPPAPKGTPPAGQHPAPKNLKLLTPAELMPAMRAFKTALGVECSFCHVQGNFASDERHEKEMARHMITLARDINSKFSDGKMHVTCYTCHRGSTEPAMAPEGAPAPPAGAPPAEAPPPPPPAK